MPDIAFAADAAITLILFLRHFSYGAMLPRRHIFRDTLATLLLQAAIITPLMILLPLMPLLMSAG